MSNFECHCVAEKIPDDARNGIRRNVCQGLPFYKEFNGNRYCVLHYPSVEKIQDFNEVYNKKVNNEEFKLTGVYFPNPLQFDKREFKKGTDFSYCNFANTVNFSNTKFLGTVKFNNSTFLEKAIFYSTAFLDEIDFSNANFLKKAEFSLSGFTERANFSKCDFYEQSSFRNCEFSKDCVFSDAKFWDTANFTNLIFRGYTSFRKVSFQKYANFGKANFINLTDFSEVSFNEIVKFLGTTFDETSQVFFDRTFFRQNVDFSRAIIKGFIYFEGGEGNYFDFEKKEYKKQISPVFGGELTLEKARLEAPEKVHFYKTALQPHWFVNVKSSDLELLEVHWKNVEDSNTRFNVKAELDCFENHGTKNSKQLFKIACRQLAENAEKNNRFEEASNFRRMAMQTEWLEKKEKISNWLTNLVSENEKLKRRFSGSTQEEDKAKSPANSFGILRRSGDFFIHGLYRISSFYGESWSWAIVTLMAIIFLIFPLIYTQTNFQNCPKEKPVAISLNENACLTGGLSINEAVAQSLTAATLQNVDYRKPMTSWGEIFIILEKIFAPLQAALLALAIRRKFMR